MQANTKRRLLIVLTSIAALMVIQNLFVSPAMSLRSIGHATRDVQSHLGSEDLDHGEIRSVLQDSLMQSHHEWILAMVFFDVVILIVLAVLIYRADARDQRVGKVTV